MDTTLEMTPVAAAPKGRTRAVLRFVRRHPTLALGSLLLGVMVLVAFFAPLLAGDPLFMAPSDRLAPPGGRYLLGTDSFGRDLYARTIYGSRVSLIVGFAVAAFSVLIGL